MAVKGSRAKGVGKKVKPAPKAIPAFKQYSSTESADKASTIRTQSGAKQTAPKITGLKGILQNYRSTAPRASGGNPIPTKRIAPNKITRLKQQRATEASEARIKAYRNAPNAGKGKKSQAAVTGTKNKPTSFVVRQRAPKSSPGPYKKVQASPINVDDYRKDYSNFAATEKRNKQVNDLRERSRIKAARRKRYG